MTGKEKILAAFSPNGTREIPAVICYERLVMRDHWGQICDYPWWYWYVSEVEKQLQWRGQAMGRLGQDWFRVVPFYTEQERESLRLEHEGEAVFLRDVRGGERKALPRLKVGGESEQETPVELPENNRQVDEQILRWLKATPTERFAQVGVNDSSFEHMSARGSDALAKAMQKAYGEEYFCLHHILCPLWSCFSMWGYENALVLTATRPELVEHACGRMGEVAVADVAIAAEIGVDGIWLEECMMDMISPGAYETLNLGYVREIVEAIRAAGMKSVYYYTGNPADKWEQIMATGADGLAFEEGKKGFANDIRDIIEVTKGRFCLLGNLDAIGVLQDGSEEELGGEIQRQLEAGRQNGNRFIMSLGSPVTPATPIARVRAYCDKVRASSGSGSERFGADIQ